MAGTMAEIGIKRTLSFRTAGQDGGAELPEIGAPLFDGRRAIPQKGGALPGEALAEHTLGRDGSTSVHGSLPWLQSSAGMAATARCGAIELQRDSDER
jgi:hypothetical protein